MIISVASGKGGTGKTTVAVNFALSLKNVQFLDCDVEEPNAHIFLKPRIQTKIYISLPVPEIIESKCTYCGKCKEVCEFNAIVVLPPTDNSKGQVMIFDHLCHNCGACTLFCPEKAIKEKDKIVGVVESGNSGNIEFIQGKMNIGEVSTPTIINSVKKYLNRRKIVIIDSPPGVSCPFLASVKGSDFSLLVTEPTPFGLHDLIKAVKAIREMKIPFGVVINRFNIGDKEVEKYCEAENIPVLMKIPYNEEFARLYSQGIPYVKHFENLKEEYQLLHKNIEKILCGDRK